MGKVQISEKSADNLFQFTLWDNDNDDFIIEIKKFFKGNKGQKDFTKSDRMTFTPGDFEKFKTWIVKFKK